MLTDMDKSVLVALAESGMDKTEAAKKAYRSRQNIYQCINRVKRKTGLDPCNVFQLAELLGLEKVRHGEWLYHDKDFNDMVIVKCSECNVKRIGVANYCPHCGAKMEGVAGDG